MSEAIEWKVVPGYEYVEVTRDGRARSVARSIPARNRWGTINSRTYESIEYAPYECGNGYLRVAVAFQGKKRQPTYLHRLVALTFVDGFTEGFHVNHINGIKKDNRAENLEWVPLEKNVELAWEDGLCVGIPSKLTAKRVRAIRQALSAGLAHNTIAILAEVSRATIKSIRDGRTWQQVQG